MMALANPAAEAEARVARVPAGVVIGHRREQQCACVRRHMQAIGDERDRAEHEAADDLGNHHHGAKPDHHPGSALGSLMAGA
jgi:hypothetical protein